MKRKPPSSFDIDNPLGHLLPGGIGPSDLRALADTGALVPHARLGSQVEINAGSFILDSQTEQYSLESPGGRSVVSVLEPVLQLYAADLSCRDAGRGRCADMVRRWVRLAGILSNGAGQ